jgi:choline-sulfatase
VRPTNVLIIMSDQHSRRIAGCYGDPVVRTPNLDALAREGTQIGVGQ